MNGYHPEFYKWLELSGPNGNKTLGKVKITYTEHHKWQMNAKLP
jgi:epoxyqueuosine reductase QueG